MKKITSIGICLVLCVSILAAAFPGPMGQQSSQTAAITDTSRALETTLAVDELISARDSRSSYDPSLCTQVDLDSLDGCKITEEGSYILSGTLNGQIIIDAGDQAKVQLILQDATIKNSGDAALYIKSADKVFLTLVGASSIESSGFESAEDKVDGAIFSKSDLSINGTGSLKISSADNGIVVKDSLVIVQASLNITSTGHGLDVNDSIAIKDAELTINAQKDGMHCESDTEGFIYISQASLSITSAQDGIDSSSEILISGGSYEIVSGGSSSKATKKANEMDYRGWTSAAVTEEEDISTKAIKAYGLLVIEDGSFVLDSCDDAIHSNTDILISGGLFSIKSGDDGMHADGQLEIDAGLVKVLQSYEGLEATVIVIRGSELQITASDDGFNASDGTQTQVTAPGAWGMGAFDQSSGCLLLISGGNITASASGDGLDSNGSLLISGGTTIVYGPTNDGNGALDYGISGQITGGTLIAFGSSGMAQGVSSTVQPTMLISTSSQAAGTKMSLKQSSSTILEATSLKAFSSVVISTPLLEASGSYSLNLGSSSQSITLSGLSYSSQSNSRMKQPGRFF
ncbi:MAG: carbohydrate-binding domain-containing protein [Sphaerochaetaceae bacterium]